MIEGLMHSLRNVVVFGGVMLGSVLYAQTQSGPNRGNILPFPATEKTLANGLRVIIVPTGFPNLVSLQIPVQAGSRNEVEPGKSGFAHFFEHLMFRGTPNTPPEKYREVMTKAGARENAGTGDDSTHYYATFAKEDLETVLATYADMFQNLAYSEAAFKTEARAILGEYNKNSADPYRQLFEVQRDRYYEAHTYKHTTMGFLEDIEDMPNQYAYSKTFFERWYRPDYTTLIVAGDVDPDRTLALVDKYWGAWKPRAGAPVSVPQEPPPTGPKYVHVPWESETLPIVSIAFPAPGFDERSKETAAMEILSALFFGPTSDVYRKLVVNEQKVDQLDVDVPSNFDASLLTVVARMKRASDAIYVRDELMTAAVQAFAWTLPDERLADAKSFSRYSFSRTLDSTERIAAVAAGYSVYRRSYETVNNYYRTLDSLTPADIQAAATKYFTDQGLIVTTLSKEPLPGGIERLPRLTMLKPAPPSTPSRSPAVLGPAPETGAKTNVPLVQQKSLLPQLNVKLLFTVGSAHDPAGKEGLAALTAAMMTKAGSMAMTIEEIEAALYPLAGSFRAQTDREMTSFTGIIHRDQWQRFLSIVLPQLVEPGYRPEDFTRLKQTQLNALVQDLRSNNEEELGRERLQVNIFRGTPYGHTSLGTVAGLESITLDDVKQFARTMYTRANLTLAVSGDAPDAMLESLQAAAGRLPEARPTPRVQLQVAPATGTDVEILEKDTRSTAISFGFPIDVTRAHPDFAALSVARAWLGEHRMSAGRLFQRIREVRGMNYGDYAYIEAFPRGMFQFFPDPNIVRQRQLFEIWIRPVVPEQAHMALRIAVHELRSLISNGLTKEAFDVTRDYLMKNVYVMTARQDEQLGYALDSRWYGTAEFTAYMRDSLQRLTVEQVNAAITRHLTSDRLSIVIIAKDAQALKKALVADVFSPIQYDSEKPKELLDEDRVVGAMKLSIAAERVRITPIDEVFAF
jgi:zinc protease